MYCISHKVKIEACLLERSQSCFCRDWLNHLIATGLCNKENAKKSFILYVKPSKCSPFLNHRSLRLTSIVFILSSLLLLTFSKPYNSEPFIQCDCEIRCTFLIRDRIFFSTPWVVRILEVGNSLPTPRTFPRINSPCWLFTVAPPCLFVVESLASKSTWCIMDHVCWLNEWMKWKKNTWVHVLW